MNQRKRVRGLVGPPIANTVTTAKPMRGAIKNSVAYKPTPTNLGKIKGTVTGPK